jgi:hypothetical protein
MTRRTTLREASGKFVDELSEQVHRLLTHPEIASDIANFPHVKDQLRKSIAAIVRERPADFNTRLEATRKALHAITGTLNIFISYKRSQHAVPAAKLQTALQAFGGNKVDIFLDTASLAYGKNWYQTIGQKLQDANCFILLVPDDTDEREWPIFETGYFAGQMLPLERLICLHHPDIPVPKQVEMYHAVAANVEQITQLFRDIFVKNDFIAGLEGINPKSEQLLPAAASDIASSFGSSRIVTRNTINFVTLQLVHAGVLAGAQDLLGSTVIDGRGLDEMFSYNGEMPVLFRDVLLVEDGKLDRHEDWLTEITEVMLAEIGRRNPPIPFAKFAKADRTRFFRPLVRLVREEQRQCGGRVICGFEVDFGEHLAGPVTNPDGLQVMEAAIRLAARFRTEIIRPFEYAATATEVDRAHRLLDSLEREAADEGLRNKALVSEQFTDDKEKREVIDMYDKWEKTYRNKHHSGRLDKALINKDPVELQKCLRELRVTNQRFLELAAERYTSMVRDLRK